jgi:hypothetical protein
VKRIGRAEKDADSLDSASKSDVSIWRPGTVQYFLSRPLRNESARELGKLSQGSWQQCWPTEAMVFPVQLGFSREQNSEVGEFPASSRANCGPCPNFSQLASTDNATGVQ